MICIFHANLAEHGNIRDIYNVDRPDGGTMTQSKTMMTEKDTATWMNFELDGIQLKLDVFADKSALTVRKDDSLTSLIQDFGSVRIILWAGPGQTLDAWRKRLDLRNEAQFEPETDVTVCGKPGRRQIATVVDAGAAGSFINSDGSIDHRYTEAITRMHVCVSFIHAGQSILQCWIVDKNKRSALAALESRFFTSLQCR